MNRLFLLLFGAVTYVAHAQIPDYVPSEGLVGWYPLDGNAVDASASNEAGELNGVNEAENRFNEPNTALQFEGAISFVNLGLENFLSLTEDDTLSLAAWAMPEADGSGAGALISKYQNINLGSSWLVGYEPPYGFRILGDGTSGTPYPADWSSQCPNDPSGWSHLAVVFQGGSCVFWLNGQFICESTFPVSSLSQEQPVLLGRSNCPDEQLCNQFSGKLDDVGFWNRALTEEEILALYNAPAPTPGCTDPTSCNYNAEATSDDGSCIPSGCMEPEACNYNSLAECAGEACDYTCCPGPGCCLEGTVWDAELGGCIPIEATCPEDLDFDGVVGVNDLMELLSAFGTDCAPAEEPETAEWTCGDPVSYHGYDYATVQIGEQCWFAENLRTELYQNGDSIPDNLSNSEWTSTTFGASSYYGENGNDCSPDCDEELNLFSYGRMYNGYAVTDERKICPVNWSVSSDADWQSIELAVGMDSLSANSTGWRGSNEGLKLKSSECSFPIWNGTNELGLNISAGSGRAWSYGTMWGVGIDCCAYYWAPESGNLFSRNFEKYEDGINRNTYPIRSGMYVRCIKD